MESDSKRLLVCDACRRRHPKRQPVKVGAAWTDGTGDWTVLELRRTGKGSNRAQPGSRLVHRGIPLQIQWADGSSINSQQAGLGWKMHGRLVGETPTVGVFQCPQGHELGFPNTETLIECLELALDGGVREIPIPELARATVIVPGRRLNRIEPRLPVTAMKTYEVAAPLLTHWRNASCSEKKCPAYTEGWITACDETTTLGAAQADYIRHNSGRSFTETREDGLTVFTFAPGQDCFEQHLIKIGRPELFIVRGGDWRGNPRREQMTHDSPDNWVEDFAEHQDRLAEALA